MAIRAQKAVPVGPKKGHGASWGRKEEAKVESRRRRREDGKQAARR